MELEDVDEIIRLPLPQLLGHTLFNNQVDKARRDIMAMLSSSVAKGVLPPDFKLMRAKTSFAMYSHLTRGDWQHLHVKQNNVWAKITKGGIVLDSSTEVTCVNQVYDRHFTNSDIAPMQDGGPKVIERMSQTAYTDTVKTCFIVVLGGTPTRASLSKSLGVASCTNSFYMS